MCRTWVGLFSRSSASKPPNPFAFVAIGRLCQAEKFSSWVHPIHSLVNPHG